MQWLILTAIYLWLGFTVGYFFRKWVGSRLEPQYRASLAGEDTANRGPSADLGSGHAAGPPSQDAPK